MALGAYVLGRRPGHGRVAVRGRLSVTTLPSSKLRWLDGTAPSVYAFGFGGYKCVGQNLAYTEIKLVRG